MPTPPPGTPDLDLTLAGTAGSINGAVFLTGETQSAGTGAFNAFVQIQRTGTEQGYNTDASAQYDENFAHSQSFDLARGRSDRHRRRRQRHRRGHRLSRVPARPGRD